MNAQSQSSTLKPLPEPHNLTAQQYSDFHNYRWDLDQDFLGGVVLALGGYSALRRTASQANTILHSRIFYYNHIKHIAIPYAGYLQWLRSDPSTPLWEWSLLESLCRHKNRPSIDEQKKTEDERKREDVIAAEEKQKWLNQLLGTPTSSLSSQQPSWQTHAPKSELHVKHTPTVSNEETDQAPYPDSFAKIIIAVQSGKQPEGIIDVPETIARNPDTRPFGKMTRPRKPWESDDSTPHGDGKGFVVDANFPDLDDDV